MTTSVDATSAGDGDGDGDGDGRLIEQEQTFAALIARGMTGREVASAMMVPVTRGQCQFIRVYDKRFVRCGS